MSTEEVLAGVRAVFKAFSEREASLAHAKMRYRFDPMPWDGRDERSRWAEVAAALRKSDGDALPRLQTVSEAFTRETVDVYLAVGSTLAANLFRRMSVVRNELGLPKVAVDRFRQIDEYYLGAKRSLDEAAGLSHADPRRALVLAKDSVQRLSKADADLTDSATGLGGPIAGVLKKLEALRDELHDLDNSVKTSDARSSRFGIWSVVIGLGGLALGLIPYLIHLIRGAGD
ncbi:MAG: hypothetical protein WAZ94_10630 [Phycisphaerales bacterium]